MRLRIEFGAAGSAYGKQGSHALSARAVPTDGLKAVQPSASPVQLQVRLAPYVFPSSLEKHLFIKAAEFYSFFYANIQDGHGRILPPVSAVHEAHLGNS